MSLQLGCGNTLACKPTATVCLTLSDQLIPAIGTEILILTRPLSIFASRRHFSTGSTAIKHMNV